MSVVRVTYNGVDGAENLDVGAATGLGDILQAGKTYDVPRELAERLVASGGGWELPRGSTVKPRETVGESAPEAVLPEESQANVAATRAAEKGGNT